MSQIRICTKCGEIKLEVENYSLWWDNSQKVYYYRTKCNTCTTLMDSARHEKRRHNVATRKQRALADRPTSWFVNHMPEQYWDTITILHSPLKNNRTPYLCRGCNKPITHEVEYDVFTLYLKHLKEKLVRLYPIDGTPRYNNRLYCQRCSEDRKPLIAQRAYLPETWPIDELLELERYSRTVCGMNSGSLYDPIA